MAEDTNNTEQGAPVPPVPEPSEPVAQPVPPAQPQPQPQQPPMGQQMPPQQPYQAPQPTYQPQPQPMYMPAPLMQLTGGMKFGWFVVGALMGIPGIVISWLVNVDKLPQVKSDALKWTIIGFVVWIVLGILIGLAIGGMITAMVAGAMGTAGYYGYDYHGTW
ncbi:spore coat protein SP96 [Gordonibacter massiliensis (ex Traore et al. 2017)]|uniref:Spore coat protein SP96 n=1 Tax=Gordonibacter massiliensis (ex Traore et al. 2017) TaxID=1841863 RepID=A0A842J8D7_9ACTN|nr:spore coat protein SP96 [Gordonibacter massiliensis (ex Traore et al. 2017)]MBC2888282.1 spore coat protein SP96 [Gordonibacter massiliensis (ex Traore et al. 2017)]MBX9032920.1 spore coat protein SP96 [Gordonibacter massiliensis (ex Traore et al. 2017)]